MQTRPIRIATGPLAQGRIPAICAPLVAKDTAGLVAEAAAVAAMQPDLLEWRVDHFSAIADPAAVLEAARCIRAAAPGLPLLFTRRSQREGGGPIAIGEEAVLAIYARMCEERLAELVDYEMASDAACLREIRAVSRRRRVGLVLSFHDFDRTPAADAIVAKFELAESLEADVGKVAVMPRTMDDVLTLLQATLRASRACAIPVVSMSMGASGALTRVGGGLFGSALTFAVGAGSSAPGQLPIAEVRRAVELLGGALTSS